jgi:hypothetical protein
VADWPMGRCGARCRDRMSQPRTLKRVNPCCTLSTGLHLTPVSPLPLWAPGIPDRDERIAGQHRPSHLLSPNRLLTATRGAQSTVASYVCCAACGSQGGAATSRALHSSLSNIHNYPWYGTAWPARALGSSLSSPGTLPHAQRAFLSNHASPASPTYFPSPSVFCHVRDVLQSGVGLASR